ncbi:MAG: class I SAM-dependent methyltransferase [Williamsia sp.]|nr:class I SAM-dependent methyltransferase [Williamsia sp.]
MNWDTKLYDNHHGFVSKYGAGVIDLLAPKAGEHILDVGCGTGDLAYLIARHGAKVTGMDSSREMIAAARDKYPFIVFDVKSAENFSYAEQFDAVFSNAALHWVLDYTGAVRCIHRALKPAGRFIAEFGGKGNVSNIREALKKSLEQNGYTQVANKSVWYFPSLSEYTSLLEHNGFRVIFASHFDRETLLEDDGGIRNWLKMFGQSYLKDIGSDETEAIIKQVEEQIRNSNFKNDTWHADYVRLRIMAVKQ